MFFADISAWTLRNIVIRLVTAMALGGLIGIDRGAKRRGGGARTDSAVCIGAALVMMTGQYIEIRWPGLADISRMASQVVSGVGFLGAGSILVSGHQVKGLTSAAGIWLSACIGLAVGIGFVDGAVLATLVLLAGLHLLPLLEEKIYQYSRYVILYVEAEKHISHGITYHTLNGSSLTVLGTLEKEGRRLGDGFLRVHRSYLAAKGQIVAVRSGYLTLSDRREIPCSLKMRSEVRRWAAGN